MSKQAAVPDAWDDDWEAVADQQEEAEKVAEARKESKAERLAKHAEQNRRLWDSAESPDNYHFLGARNEVPLKSEFKPSVKVLSRKPTPKLASRNDPSTGLAQLTVEDDDEDADNSGKSTTSPEELRKKAQLDREEKQRRYEEARERLFGSPAPESGTSTPGNVTPPRPSSRGEAKLGKGKGKARVGRESNLPLRPKEDNSEQGGRKQLYDPDYAAKADLVYIQKRTGEALRNKSVAEEGLQPIRAPRGPDGTGRGAFLAGRGKVNHED
ncbi:MAG: hypothetical protein M1833_001057 [Piccolia ochrophora]|nr:MAG: hypothetical protein M1833_001057 [Piccolia ochrophora]